MPKNNSLFSSSTLLALAVGVFLLLSGVQTLIDLNSPLGKVGSFFSDKTTNTIVIVIAILKIVSGAVLAIGPFGLLNLGIRQLAFWVVVAFWAVYTVYASFFGGPILKPTPMVWVQTLSLNVAILAAVWQLKPEGK